MWQVVQACGRMLWWNRVLQYDESSQYNETTHSNDVSRHTETLLSCQHTERLFSLVKSAFVPREILSVSESERESLLFTTETLLSSRDRETLLLCPEAQRLFSLVKRDSLCE